MIPFKYYIKMQEQQTVNVESQQVRRKKFVDYIIRGDKVVWFIYIVLFAISMVEIFSATSQLVTKTHDVAGPAVRHITYLFVGFVMLMGAQSMSLRSLRSWDKLFYLAGFFLLLATILFGTEMKGAVRSIAGIQPVEVCKLGVIMLLCTAVTASDAAYHKLPLFRTRTRYRRFWFYLILIGLMALPIATQNLSSAMIIFISSFGVMFVGKVYGKYLWFTIAGVLVSGALFVGILYNVYQRNPSSDSENTEVAATAKQTSAFAFEKIIDRSSTWANRLFGGSDKPLWEEDITGKKSQELCAHMAVANSYPFGRMIGRSKLRDFLPEAFSDYIFAIIFEEWGFLGALFVMSLYLALFYRCFRLSQQTENQFVRLLMIGLPLTIVVQALMHIGVCTGAMFVTGQPLPLISRGGSSIFGTSISFGIILAMSRLISQEQMQREQAALEPEAE